MPSGFVDLDEMTSGFQKSDLVIVAARPAMGKTSFVLNIALHAAIEAGKTVGIFSLEMSKEQLFMRMLTSEARVDAHRFRGGFLGEQDYARLVDAFARLHDAKVFIDDTPSVGILEMRAKARRLKLEHGLDLLVIDYLQLMQGRGRFENRQQEMASISRSLKILAKELEIPIIALSQLSRAPEARGDQRPQLSDLRESGALEQDADVVMFIFREEMYARTASARPEAEGIAEIIIGKQRNGPDRHGAAGVPQAVHAVREPGARRLRRAETGVIRPTVASVDLEAIAGNLRAIHGHARRASRAAAGRRTPPGIIAVVKANAYGHGAAQVGPALEEAGASMLACADIEEGVTLREAGVDACRFSCSARSASAISTACSTPTHADRVDARPRRARSSKAAAARGVRSACHLKIDTGMNRLGFRHDNLRRTMPDVLGEPAPAHRRGVHALRDGRRARVAVSRGAARRVSSAPRRRSARWASRGVERHAANSAALLRDTRDVVRLGASRSAALRHRAAAARRGRSRAATCPVTDEPYRGGEGRARRARARATACAGGPTGRGRSRSCRPATPTASTRGWAAAASCSSAAAACRSSARCAWT